jgi:hypothetical protein
MGKKNKTRSQQRQQKAARRKSRQTKAQVHQQRNLPASPDTTTPETRSTLADGVITIEDGPMVMATKITRSTLTPDGKNITHELTPLEDTILPVPLAFDPPLQALSTNEKGFQLHWQQLTYLFHLADPSTFSDIGAALTEDDARLLVRFAQTCCRLARYSAVSASSSVSVSIHRDETISVQAELPDDEVFAGFSATFRQLHNQGEEAGFDKAWQVLNKALNTLVEDGSAPESDRAVLTAWKKARNKLNAKTATTMICETLVPEPADEKTLSLKGIVPEQLIKTYNYGNTPHWGDYREEFAELTNDPDHQMFYSFCCLTSMVSLSHLYFGFATLIAAALGQQVQTA